MRVVISEWSMPCPACPSVIQLTSIREPVRCGSCATPVAIASDAVAPLLTFCAGGAGTERTFRDKTAHGVTCIVAAGGRACLACTTGSLAAEVAGGRLTCNSCGFVVVLARPPGSATSRHALLGTFTIGIVSSVTASTPVTALVCPHCGGGLSAPGAGGVCVCAFCSMTSLVTAPIAGHLPAPRIHLVFAA